MSIELKPGDYVLGIWVFDNPPYNLLGIVRKSEGQWIFDVRTRTYVDDKIFDSKDRKRFWQVTYKPDQTEESVLESVREMFHHLSTIEGDGTYHETLVKSTDPYMLHQALKKTPYIHIMPMSKG